MGSFNGLTRKKEFNEVYNKGNSVVDRLLVLYCLPNSKPFSRFGFSVGKKVGKAVIRNRLKRIMREICRTNIRMIKEGYDCVIIVRPRSAGEKYSSLEKSFLKLAGKAKIIKREMTGNETTDNGSY